MMDLPSKVQNKPAHFCGQKCIVYSVAESRREKERVRVGEYVCVMTDKHNATKWSGVFRIADLVGETSDVSIENRCQRHKCSGLES